MCLFISTTCFFCQCPNPDMGKLWPEARWGLFGFLICPNKLVQIFLPLPCNGPVSPLDGIEKAKSIIAFTDWLLFYFWPGPPSNFKTHCSRRVIKFVHACPTLYPPIQLSILHSPIYHPSIFLSFSQFGSFDPAPHSSVRNTWSCLYSVDRRVCRRQWSLCQELLQPYTQLLSGRTSHILFCKNGVWSRSGSWFNLICVPFLRVF